ncbi:non-ribosomal peptide synthetase [Pyrenochaeta sp. MPI-SDFR-AT-0127]|nr:non-ribosomal peptide synthetase [Pyrenochaeta sp. MPI-SDFR-AT-0127]
MDLSPVNLCELFAQAVGRCPDNLAVDHDEGCLTYRGLDDSSTVFARTLVSLGVSKVTPVVLVTAHGSLNIIAILAILKAGSCFVPIDRGSWSKERIEQVFDTVQCSLVINTTAEPFTPPHESCQVLNIQIIPRAGPLERHLDLPSLSIDPDDTACIMFTSGSTGRPKGVMISHKSLCLYSTTQLLNMDIQPGDRLLHILSVAFDACACVLFSALCNGGTVVPAVPADLYQKATSCTVMAATPSLLHNLPTPASDERMFSNMHTVILGGETAAPDLLESWIDAGVRMFTAYGLSETTSMGTIHRVERDPETGRINPFIVGAFMDESPIYLLGQDLAQIAQDGVDGEIAIGGSGLTKGYYKDDHKTKLSFIEWNGLRLYKTGDYGRWIRGPSNNRLLEFVGRRDRCIKNQGFSVNLDRDVEEKLYLTGLSLGVKSVHALATDSGIIVVVTPSCVDTVTLLQKAQENMCSYCIPCRIEAIEEFPLSSSGKAQSQKILDVIASIENRKDPGTQVCREVAKKVETSRTCPTPEDQNLLEVLRAAGEVLGCSGGKRRDIKGEDTFIEMGGSSLLAIKLVSVLRRLKLHLSVRDLFSCRTFSEIARCASTTVPPDPAARWIAEDPLTARNLADLRAKACTGLGYTGAKFDIGPLTSLQLELAMPTLANEAMNVNQAKFSYSCEHVSIAEKAWSAVWRAEPVFRTEISLAIGSGAQIVHREPIRKPNAQYHDCRIEYEAAIKHSSMCVGLGCRLDLVFYRQHTTSNAVGSRINTQREKSELTVILTIHHSLMDGSSLEFLLDNVERAVKGRPLTCGTSSVDANLGLIAIQRMHDRQARSFFDGYLKDVPIENKATERYHMAMQLKQTNIRHQTTTAWFTPSVSIQHVTEFARNSFVSAACVYYCAWAMAISTFERCDNVVIGAVFSNRSAQAGHERTIGPYMATLPLVVNLKSDETINNCLQRTMNGLIDLREFAWARSDQIGIGHRLGSILALQLPMPNEKSSPPPLRVETLENSDFPLSMLVEADGNLRILYDNRQYRNTMIQRIGEHFKSALYSITKESFVGDCMRINNLHETLLEGADFTLNSTGHETVKTALEHSAGRFRDYTALEDCFGNRVTYEELDKMSNAIAHTLNDILPDADVIAVFGDGTIKWILSIVGILKTGRIYVPLDPKWSMDRRATVCNESGATALLLPSKSQQSEAPDMSALKVLFADSILNGEIDENEITRVPDTTSPDDDLVVVYTSGSTGTPKGIPLTNRGILALLRGCPEATMFAAPGRRIAQFMSPAFDYCNIELFCTLLHGATLVLRDPDDPFAHLHKVDAATITPSVLAVLKPDDYPNLKIIYSTGEPITNVLVNKFGTRTLLYNVYGPAECSVVTSYTRAIPGDPITVGVAVPTARTYILDDNQKPVPDGTKGEIYVAGVQVMRGYLKEQEIPVQRVLMDPWHTGERMYRTGDFGLRGKDGRVTYLGRMDRQVKLRGFRVELAEVEQAIMLGQNDEGITQCTVVAINGTLVAFISCDTNVYQKEPSDVASQLQARLNKVLFSASIPQAIVQLERFPTNLNGKVDVKALERIYAKRTSIREPNSISLSVDRVEDRVAEEWRQILQLGSGAQLQSPDNFFGLGGHSVLVLLLANRLSTAFQVEITLRELLPVPSLGGQVELIKQLLQKELTENPGGSENLKILNHLALSIGELTEIERQVWVQCQAATTATAFNIVKILLVNGFIDVERLVKSFNQALASDPVFRTNIIHGPRGAERILRDGPPQVRAVAQLDIDGELNRHFDLENDQLIHIFLIPEGQQTITGDTFRIVIVTSHVIVDLGSLQNLLKLTSQAYSGGIIPLHPTPQHLESDRWTRLPTPHERAWWKEYLRGHSFNDYRKPLLRNSHSTSASGYLNGTSRTRQYSGDLITSLTARARETGTTQHQLALAATALMLQWLSGENDLVIGAPDSGRRSKIEREALGQFLDRLPIRVILPQPTAEITTNLILADLRDSAHMALANAIPFSQILETMDFPGDISDYPLFECMVTFHTRAAFLKNWLQLPNCIVSETSLYAPGSKFPLMLEWFESDTDQWMVHIEFDTDRVLPATIDAIEHALDLILDAVANNSLLSRLQDQLGRAIELV